MIETYCRPNIHERCVKEAGQRPLVCLRGESPPIWEWERFFSGMGAFPIIWQKNERKRGSNITVRYAVGLMARNGEELGQAWVNDRFSGDWQRAMRAYENFDSFFEGFEAYFCERREKFLEKTKEIIDKRSLAEVGKIRTSSHGGVANLLKVLTKTMHDQGSTIRTIAKVQYAVCTQAGIYIPDEFITDVLVASDIDPNIWEQDEGKTKYK